MSVLYCLFFHGVQSAFCRFTDVSLTNQFAENEFAYWTFCQQGISHSGQFAPVTSVRPLSDVTDASGAVETRFGNSNQ